MFKAEWWWTAGINWRLQLHNLHEGGSEQLSYCHWEQDMYLRERKWPNGS